MEYGPRLMSKRYSQWVHRVKVKGVTLLVEELDSSEVHEDSRLYVFT